MELFIPIIILAIAIIAAVSAIAAISASIICIIINTAVRLFEDDDDEIMDELYHD